MHNPTPHTKPLLPLWRWSLALLLVCGFGVLANVQYPASIVEPSRQSGFIAALDVPLAYHQHLSAIKRSNPGQKDEGNPDPWGMLLVEVLQHVVAHLDCRLPASPEFPPALYAVIKQPLVPRAPPLV